MKIKPSDLKSNIIYTCTEGHPAKGDVLYTRDRFKISDDKKIVSVYDKKEKEWVEYLFNEIFPDNNEIFVKELKL